MKKYTFMFIPEAGTRTREFKVPKILVLSVALAVFVITAAFVGVLYDYSRVAEKSKLVEKVMADNDGLRNEAQLLQTNLQGVKVSLNRIQDYAVKLNEISALTVSTVSQGAGLERRKISNDVASGDLQMSDPSVKNIPLGVDLDQLEFKPVLNELAEVKHQADTQALEMQSIIASLGQRKSMFMSMPTIPPVKGWYASGFGKRVSPFTGKPSMHRGLDIAASVGTPIVAPAEGVVVYAAKKSTYGNFVMIAHGYGLVTSYAHCEEIFVKEGQRVKRGDKLATVGKTGRVTGPHLHYEVTVNGQHVDPKKFILDSNAIFLTKAPTKSNQVSQ